MRWKRRKKKRNESVGAKEGGVKSRKERVSVEMEPTQHKKPRYHFWARVRA